jgi:hypothetical protein
MSAIWYFTWRSDCCYVNSVRYSTLCMSTVDEIYTNRVWFCKKGKTFQVFFVLWRNVTHTNTERTLIHELFEKLLSPIKCSIYTFYFHIVCSSYRPTNIMLDIVYCLRYVWYTQHLKNWLFKWKVVLYQYIFLTVVYFNISGGNCGPMRELWMLG